MSFIPAGAYSTGIYEMQKIVSCRCTQCAHDITFVVPEDKIRRGTFPIILQNQHGIPPHKLMILITHNFQVKPFAVEDVSPAPSQVSSILSEFFNQIGLSSEELETYFQCLQERPLTISEISQIGQFSPKKAQILAEKLGEKGFFKIIGDDKGYYQPMPPYAAILAQFEQIADYVHNFQGEIPKELEQSFKALEQQAKELRDPQEFLEILKAIFGGVSAMVNAILSQIFAKLNQGSSIVGQFWDRAKSVNHVNRARVEEELSKCKDLTSPKVTSPVKNDVILQSRHYISLQPPPPHENSDVIAKLEELEEKVNEFESGNEAADYIQQLRGQFQTTIGFVPALNDMMNWINQLRHGFAWDHQGKDVLLKRVKYWEEKFTEHLSKPSF